MFMTWYFALVLLRIRFGSNNLYIFRNPSVAEEARRQHKNITFFTYEDAQEEIARNSGLDFSNGNGLSVCVLKIQYFINTSVAGCSISYFALSVFSVSSSCRH